MDISTRFNEVGSINMHQIPKEEIARLAKQFNCFLEHFTGETRDFDSFVLKIGETEIKFFS